MLAKLHSAMRYGSCEFKVSNAVIQLPRWLRGKDSICSVGPSGVLGLISELGRSPGGGHGNPFQYSCLENGGQRSLMGCSL